jgi:hypothetical protein
MRICLFKDLAARYHISRFVALRGYVCAQKEMSIIFLATLNLRRQA